jgi:hypothetical protein
MILMDYSEKLERVLEDMREVVDNVTSLRRQPERQDLAASSSKGVPNLSKLSLPDSFSGLSNVEDYTGVDVTPESKGVQGPKDARKGKSLGKNDRDVIMTSFVQGSRIRIRKRPFSDTGSPPEAWTEGLQPRLGDGRVCHT